MCSLHTHSIERPRLSLSDPQTPRSQEKSNARHRHRHRHSLTSPRVQFSPVQSVPYSQPFPFLSFPFHLPRTLLPYRFSWSLPAAVVGPQKPVRPSVRPSAAASPLKTVTRPNFSQVKEQPGPIPSPPRPEEERNIQASSIRNAAQEKQKSKPPTQKAPLVTQLQASAAEEERIRSVCTRWCDRRLSLFAAETAPARFLPTARWEKYWLSIPHPGARSQQQR